MSWRGRLRGDPLSWLLQIDHDQPGVRYLTLTEILGRPADDDEVIQARAAAMSSGPIPAILGAQRAEGYWEKPGPGYGPKYRGTVWQVIFLAQLGADGADPRVRAAGNYVLDHSRTDLGGFSADGTRAGQVHCLQGNLCHALLALGWLGDPRLDAALDWLARSITGEGIAPSTETQASARYMRSGNSAPGFCCAANNQLPCAWGAVKAMLGLSQVPEFRRTPAISAAIAQGLEFLLGRDPAAADYPCGYSDKPSTSWFRFGYPLGYVTDVLQNLEALTALGCGHDPRLNNALEMVLQKQDEQGRWRMDYTYNGKMWADIESKGQPSKWVTWRALRVLHRASQ